MSPSEELEAIAELIPIKTRKQILALFCRPPRESSHQNPHK